jgi:hypothetical protein
MVEIASLDMVRASNLQDEVFIVNFNDEPWLDFPMTSDIKVMREGIARIDSSAAGSLAPRTSIRLGRDESDQNSSRAWNAPILGLLSPPRSTPSSPVGGEVVPVIAPNPVCVAGLPGIPAFSTLGSAKLGWLKILNNCPSMRSFTRSEILNGFA